MWNLFFKTRHQSLQHNFYLLFLGDNYGWRIQIFEQCSELQP